jgi:hypothetical protein
VALEDDLVLIEASIRQLQIEWDKFFGGVERKPPTDQKTRLEALLRRHANAEIRNNAERFRYQSLTARYAAMSELWTKKLRAMEEGRPMGLHGSKLPPPPPPPPPPSSARAPEKRAAAAEYRVRRPDAETEVVRALFEQYQQARTQAGEGGVKFESFQKVIAQQASRILTEKGGQAVEFRVETKDGKVSLKAKAVK